MTVAEYASKVSHREHKAWLAWLEMDRSRPSRADTYSMQVAAEVHRIYMGLAGIKGQVKLADFVLQPEQPTAVTAPVDPEVHKAVWSARLGMPLK